MSSAPGVMKSTFSESLKKCVYNVISPPWPGSWQCFVYYQGGGYFKKSFQGFSNWKSSVDKKNVKTYILWDLYIIFCYTNLDA